MKVVAIIQARMGSTRLPGKVLLDLAGESMLARTVARVQRARSVDQTLVATSTVSPDDAIARVCAERGWTCYRGSQDDVLDRYHSAAMEQGAEVIVRITSDCPLVEPTIIDGVVQVFLGGDRRVDYAANVLPPRTFPRGLDVEVIGLEALKRAWREDSSVRSREHVTPYIYSHPEVFALRAYLSDRDYSHLRWTVDTLADLELVRRIYAHFGHDQFSWLDVIAVCEQQPDWVGVNRHVQQKEL